MTGTVGFFTADAALGIVTVAGSVAGPGDG